MQPLYNISFFLIVSDKYDGLSNKKSLHIIYVRVVAICIFY